MDLDKAIKERHSTRSFTNRKPDWRKIVESIEAARYAPTAGAIFSTKFILVDDKEKIKRLATHAQQDFINQVHYVVIVCSSRKLLNNSFPDQADSFSKQQTAAAIQNFLLKLTEKGLATCWVGAFLEQKIKDDFKIPTEVDVDAIFPIGFELGKAKRRIRVDMDAFLYFNRYKNKKMQPETNKFDH